MSTAAVTALREQVTGLVVTEGHDDYEEARRVYNFMIDRRPSAVVRCANTDDVRTVVRFAAEQGADLAVRGGGHPSPASAPPTARSSPTCPP
ncbi:FAD-binding oxidoreductase [Catellatospora bangladeshensis]|uniref:FAD-binding oxidoreductase n=1 Tax=Catellatospora bangladeshensis TaxID=310355 RepID=UPI00360CD3ED